MHQVRNNLLYLLLVTMVKDVCKMLQIYRTLLKNIKFKN